MVRQDDRVAPQPPSPGTALPGRIVGIAATAAAGALAVLLAVRPFSSYDVGYHLAYGRHFLRTGRIVQTNRFIYTKLDKQRLADPDELGPGCRYDAASDTYHFINGNWLSQVVMTLAYEAGGFDGLWVLQWAMVAAIFALMAVTMRRALPAEQAGAPGPPGRRLGWEWIGSAVLLAAMTGYSRFNLRPEVFGYLMLVAQWCLLVGPRFGWRAAAGVIGLQVLAVNFHSYFLLGIALTGVMFADVFLRWVWRRSVTQEAAGAGAGRLKWLGIATAGVLLASLCNPWHVRGAVMPVQTLMFMNRHDIAGGEPRTFAKHPWAAVGEFTTPFAKTLRHTKATWAYFTVLSLAGVAGVVALLRRRWGWLAALAGMTAVSLKMRRNIAPAAMILAPLSLIVLADGWRWLAKRSSPPEPGRAPAKARESLLARLPRPVGIATAAAVIALSAWWIFAVLTQRFYYSEHRSWRFGRGVSSFSVPLAAAGWINQHAPAGNVFTGYDSSSDLMFLTHRRVPILTNTWAFPPYMMRWVFACTGGQPAFDAGARELRIAAFDRAARDYGIEVVVLHSYPPTRPLMGVLGKSRHWAVVHIGVSHVVFLRRNGANAALAANCALSQKDFDLEGYIDRIAATDPVPAFALHSAGVVLRHVGWGNAAIRLLEKCIQIDPAYWGAIAQLGTAYGLRGNAKLMLREAYKQKGRHLEAQRLREEALADWLRAEKLLVRALELKGDDVPAKSNLKSLRAQMAQLERGIYVPPKLK